MSGPSDVPDDPEDVTLWAGRLRAWPTPPARVPDAADDDIDDDTAVSPRQVPDDTVRVVRPAPSDDTVRVVRPAPSPEPAQQEAPSPEPAQPEAPSPEPAPQEAPSQEPAPHASPSPDDGPADETTLAGRRRPLPSTDLPGPDDTTPRSRVVVPVGDAPADVPEETPTADTEAGTRRARPRGGVPTAVSSDGDPAPAAREARLPVADHELYRPRADEAVRVARTAPPARPSDAPDAAEVLPRTSRRARRRGLVLALSVVLVVAAAAIGLFLLMG